MQMRVIIILYLIVVGNLAAQPTKVPVSARLSTNTFSWSYEVGGYVELPAVRYFDQFFDNKGRVIKSVEYYDNKNIFRAIIYDYSKYSLPSQIWTDNKGENSGRVEIKIEGGYQVEYLYDREGTLRYKTTLFSKSMDAARMVRERPDGTIEWVIDIAYDTEGEVVNKIMRNPDGDAVAFLTYSYTKDEFGNWVTRLERMSLYGVWSWPKEIVHRELKY